MVSTILEEKSVSKTPKINEVLNLLSNQEKKELWKFLILQTKPKSDIRELGEFAIFNNEELLASNVQKTLFPKLSLKSINNKISILKDHIEFYLAYTEVKKNEGLVWILKYQALLTRQLYGNAERIRKNRLPMDKINFSVDLDSLLRCSIISHLNFFSQNVKNENKCLSLLQDSLDFRQTQLELLFKQYKIEEAVKRKKTNDRYRLVRAEQPSNDHPLSNILDAVLRLVESQEKEDDLQLVLDYLHTYAQKDIGEIYVFILLHTIDVMISIIQKEKSFDTSELIKLYDIGLKNKAFLLRGNITPRRFGNIINAGFALKHVDWMEAVIKKYVNHLSKDTKDEVVLMSNIQVAVAKKEYQQAWDLFPPRGWELFDHEYRSRWLSAICMYKLGEYQLLESHLTAFKSYANEKKAISPRLRKGIHNFIKIMRMFMKGKSRDLIKNEFLSMDTVSAGSWIFHELNEDYPSKR